MKSKKRALAVSIAFVVILLSRLVMSPILAQIRAVDLITILALGIACGVAIVSDFGLRNAKPGSEAHRQGVGGAAGQRDGPAESERDYTFSRIHPYGALLRVADGVINDSACK